MSASKDRRKDRFRVKIMLTDDEYQRLRRRSQYQGRSIGAVMREAMEQH
ncbi:MAG: hypothetical protein M3Q30_03395 [Actinomycetota bacterium]|nr:hypothetical protein [Actinomycetota bacterium]